MSKQYYENSLDIMKPQKGSGAPVCIFCLSRRRGRHGDKGRVRVVVGAVGHVGSGTGQMLGQGQ